MKRLRSLGGAARIPFPSLFWLLTLLLVGAGARLWMLHSRGTSLPFWDQWEEARVVYLPYFNGTLSIGALFSPHNEHRIFFTRIYGLALLLLNRGQWDNEVQMVANVFLYTATIGGFGWILSRILGPRHWPLIVVALLTALALPFGWENMFGGFHSQFYFMVLFSLVTIRLVGFHPPGSLWWIAGVCAAVGSVFTVASGFLASAVLLALAGLRILRMPGAWRGQAPIMMVGFVVVGLGFGLRAEVLHHRVLMAHSAGQFFVSLGKYLAWPWIVLPAFSVVNLLPLLVLAWVYLRERNETMPAEETVLALGGWAVIQAFACAYARGAQEYPQWRYMDSICFLFVANVLGAGLVLFRHLARSPRILLWRGAFLVWGGAAVLGLILLCARAWQVDIPERRLYQNAQIQYTRAFVATGDRHVFDGLPRPYLIVFHGDPLLPGPSYPAEWTVNYLKNPQIRAMLPSCVRDPLEMAPAKVAGFTTNAAATVKPAVPGEVVWSSDNAQGPSAQSRFESQSMTRGKFPYLEFRVAGDFGEPGLSLSLVDSGSGNVTSVPLPRVSSHRWVNCRVRAPRGQFKVLAANESAKGRFAFQAPREVGPLSFWAVEVMGWGKYLTLAGLGLFLSNLVLMPTWKGPTNACSPRPSL